MVLRSLLAFLILRSVLSAEVVQIRGSVVVAQILVAAEEELKRDHDVHFRVITEGGSTPAISDLVYGDIIELAMTTRPMTPGEKSEQPGKYFLETRIGTQAVLMVVSSTLKNEGVTAINKQQAVRIYEGDYLNWTKVGGPNRKLKFFHRDPERGVWDVFAIWAYGDARKATRPKGDFVKTPSDVLTSVEYNVGSVSLLEMGLLEGEGVQPLGIKMPDGALVDPSMANIASEKYPMIRPLLLVTREKPTGTIKTLLNFMTSEAGQKYVKKLGHVTLAETDAAKPAAK